MRPAAAAAFAVVGFASAARAKDGDAPGWTPGERTTSTLPGEVSSDEAAARADGVYGRFEGRYDVGIAAGAELDGGGAAFAARATAHYFYMAGLYAGYVDGLGGESLSATRGVSFGVDLRPAFLPRWSNDMQHGPSFLDLAVDSISIGMGAYFRAPPGGGLGDVRGFELSLGFDVPLLGEMHGPWLGARGFLRWDDPKGREARAAEASALFTLGYQWVP